MRYNHVGEDGARLGNVEGNEGRVHGDLSEILASPQQFRIDRADFVQRFPQFAEVVEIAGDLGVGSVRHIVSSRLAAGPSDGEISLRPMSRSIDAVAVRTATPFVRLEQRAAQQLLDRRQAAHQFVTAFAQRCRRKSLHAHRTESN